jgi:hypothetical protein
MIGRLAVRSLTAHPVRSAVLAAGFGFGVAVMAILLGVAQIVLEQSRAPALVGGGDVLIRLSEEVPGRLVMAGALQSDALRPRIKAAAPTHTSALFLLHRGRATRVQARGGIPSLERALGDEETSGIEAWRDSADDVAWTQNTPDKVLRYVDRFHPVPDVPEWSDSWAEWLYFNGRGPGGRFYLTFLVGPQTKSQDGRRSAGVRLQLDRGNGVETFGVSQPITDAEALQAPDLTIGDSYVRLEGMRYRVHLDLTGPSTQLGPGAGGSRVIGDLTLDASAGRLVPPLELTGARGWRSGYVVPVMSGQLGGSLEIRSQIPNPKSQGVERIDFSGGTGYHDHNWGFWQGVSWQWGQVQQGDLSLLYGRVFPPANAADASRIPGFVGVLGPDGPLGYATTVTITETDDNRGEPRTIVVRGRGTGLEVELRFEVESAEITRAGGSSTLFASDPASGLDFLQMRGTYVVTGRIGDRAISFSAPGSAETFRGR